VGRRVQLCRVVVKTLVWVKGRRGRSIDGVAAAGLQQSEAHGCYWDALARLCCVCVCVCVCVCPRGQVPLFTLCCCDDGVMLGLIRTADEAEKTRRSLPGKRGRSQTPSNTSNFLQHLLHPPHSYPLIHPLHPHTTPTPSYPCPISQPDPASDVFRQSCRCSEGNAGNWLLFVPGLISVLLSWITWN